MSNQEAPPKRKEDYTFEELTSTYALILSRDKKANFARGDLAREVTRRDTEAKKKDSKADVIGEFLRETGENSESFRVRRWVAEKFPMGPLRDIPVPWTHYRVAAKTDDPILWLNKSHDEGWGVDKLKAEIIAAGVKQEVESGKLCACGCGSTLPDPPITVTHMDPTQKGRQLFATPRCVRDYANGLILVDGEQLETSTAGDQEEELLDV